MRRISDWLRDNPWVVVSMFIFTLVGGIMTIMLGWVQFYTDYLSKQIYIPVWLVIILLVFFGVISYMLARVGNVSQSALSSEMTVVEGKTFGVQQVVVDGKNFINCKFDGTELIIKGRDGFSLSHNTLQNIRFTMSDSAAVTIMVLHAMYKDPSFIPFVEGTFQSIRTGTINQSTQPHDPLK